MTETSFKHEGMECHSNDFPSNSRLECVIFTKFNLFTIDRNELRFIANKISSDFPLRKSLDHTTSGKYYFIMKGFGSRGGVTAIGSTGFDKLILSGVIIK